MKYSKMLKEIIEESHWTQEQLAAKLGVSFATVNSWINGRTKPQKSLIPDIQRLYLAQDVTREPEPVYITIINSDQELMVGDYVILTKDKRNRFDDEAIMVERVDDDGYPILQSEAKVKEVLEREINSDDKGDDLKDLEDTGPEEWEEKVEEIKVYMGIDDVDIEFKSMYVANSVNTVVRGTRSAGRIYDKFDLAARAQVVFVTKRSAIARVVDWNAAEVK